MANRLTIDSNDDDMEAGILAARAMLAALDGLLEPCTSDLTPADWQRAIDACAMARAAGITTEGE